MTKKSNTLRPVGTLSTASHYFPDDEQTTETIATGGQRHPRLPETTISADRTSQGLITDAMERVPTGSFSRALLLALLAFLFLLIAPSARAIPQYLGDLNEDNQVDVRDLVIIINHLNALQGRTNGAPRLLSFPLSYFADVNQDGIQNQSDVDALRDIILGKQPVVFFPLDMVMETSPANGESGVSVTRETIFRFSQPLAPNTELTTNHLCACFGGRQLLSRIELSTDRRKVTLFYLEPLPASARVRVTFNAAGLQDFVGRPLDPDGDGIGGGVKLIDFDTLSTTPVAGTVVIGHVFASQQVPVGTRSTGSQTTNFVDHPLPGVLVSVIGAEQELFTTTDAQGFFRLTNCPAGEFFVSIDGRTSPESSWPNGAYYPLVGKPWEAVAGRTNNLAGGTGLIYLPLVQAGTLQPVNPTTDTTIGFPPEVIAANPAWAGVSVTIPTNALYSDNGTRGGRVGLAPVPADRLPERLPPGIVHALDISIQTDGPQNVDRPLPVRFPNLPDPQTGLKLPPGAKSALMSYNHDTGRWEVQGPMTVTADGNYVETDPGVGVRQPGWHGSMPGHQKKKGKIKKPTCKTDCTDNGSLSGGMVTANATDICAGNSITFTASGVTDTGGTKRTVCRDSNGNVVSDKTTQIPGSVEYKWKIFRDGTQFSSGSGPNATVSSAQGGVYTCEFTAKANRECPPTDITLPAGPSVSVSGLRSVKATANGFSGQSYQCDNRAVSFDVDVQQLNCGTLTYSWDFAGLGMSTDKSPSFTFPGVGPYPVTVTVSCVGPSCSDTKSDTVTVRFQDLQAVEAKANGQDSVTVAAGEVVNFSAITTPANFSGLNFQWSFDFNGATGTGQNTTYAYPNPGTYHPTCTATCAGGNPNPKSDSVTVTVTGCGIRLVQKNYPGAATPVEIQSGDVAWITTEPKMPDLEATVTGASCSGQASWSLQITYNAPAPVGQLQKIFPTRSLSSSVPYDLSGEFGTAFYGGNAVLACTLPDGTHRSVSFQILGKSPTGCAIANEVKSLGGQYSDALCRITKQESSGTVINDWNIDPPKQFFANGQPLIDTRNGAPGYGIMQITPPSYPVTVDEIWNWKKNVAKGRSIFNDKINAEHQARAFLEHGFRDDSLFNARYQTLFNNYKTIHPNSPHLPAPFTDDMLMRASIREYNGHSNGLHEYEVDSEIINGLEVLKVVNGNIQWRQVEASRRYTTQGSPIGDPDYVTHVLRWTCPTCSP